MAPIEQHIKLLKPFSMKTIRILAVLFLFSQTVLNGQTISGIGNNPTLNPQASSLVCDTIFSFPTPDMWPTGIAFDGTHVFSSGNLNHFIYKYDLSGTLVDSIPNPFNQANNQVGGDMDFDGTNLLLLTEQSDTLYKIDPATGNVVNSFIVQPCNLDCFGVAFDGVNIWVLDYVPHALYKLDANSGAVLDTVILSVSSFILPIEFINGHLYGLGIFPGEIYEIDPATGVTTLVDPWCLGYSIGFCKVGNNIWGCSSQISTGGTQRIYMFESSPMSIESNTLSMKAVVYPNPSSGIINITSDRIIVSGYVELYDTPGKLLLKQDISNASEIKLEILKPEPGIYFIRIVDGNSYFFDKIIIND